MSEAMEARFDPPRSDALVILCVIWGAGALATIAGLLAYILVQSYDPSLSCHELWGKALDNSEVPNDLDAWDDWELLCDYRD